MHPSIPAGSSDPGPARPSSRPSGRLLGSRSRALAALIALAWAMLIGGMTGCDSGFPSSGSERTISDETFVETVVALRRGAASDGEASLSAGRRDEILAAQGVTEEELFQFVEVHGRNVPRMSAVWTEVEARLTGQDPEDLDRDPAPEDLPGTEPGAPGSDEEPAGAPPGGGGGPRS